MKKIRLIFLFPLGLVYGIITYFRRFLYKKNCFSSYKPPIKTICVGNIAVGGTGKTPHVEYLIRLLSTQYAVATLSRGYKRLTHGYISTFTTELPINALTIGDEPMQFHTHFPALPVAVCEKRKIGIESLLSENKNLDIILLDDAFQHLAVQCGFNIVLTEFASPYFHDFPMPAGNLREFRTAAKSADIIIVTKSPCNLSLAESEKYQENFTKQKKKSIFFTTYLYENPQPITARAQEVPLHKNSPILLLTGIANPAPLQQELSKQFSNIELITFNDHHLFTAKDIHLLQQKYDETGDKNTVIMTTEKDACRLLTNETKKRVSLLPIFSIPIKVEFLFEKELLFNQIIQDYVGKN